MKTKISRFYELEFVNRYNFINIMSS